MLTQKSKWNEILTAFETARRQARALEERENRRTSYWMLLLLLFISFACFVIFLVRGMH